MRRRDTTRRVNGRRRRTTRGNTWIQRGGMHTVSDFDSEFESHLDSLVRKYHGLIGYGWDSKLKAAKEVIHSAKTDKERTAIFQYVIQNLDVAEQIKRGDWCLWVIQARPDLYGLSGRNSAERQNSNSHVVDDLIYEYTRKRKAELVAALPSSYEALRGYTIGLIERCVDPADPAH